MRALIYARKSSDPKGRGRSVEEQIVECTEWANREGWEIVEIVRDNDRSATRYARRQREGWANVHRQLARGGVDLVVTWAASRAQRDLDAYVELRSLCTRHHVRWAYSGTVYDLNDRQDRFRTGLDALVAEDEAERNRDAVMRSMRSNAAKGRPHGRLPFGYRRVYDEATREYLRQEPDPVQAPLVQEAARRLLAGESSRSIANDWNERGIPTPHSTPRWDLTGIRRIVSNPAMNAKRVHRGEIVGEGDWPRILDDETAAKLTARFAEQTKTHTRASPTARLLTGVARCGVCGGPMVYSKQGGFGRRSLRFVYQCRTKFCTARDMTMLDAYVTSVVLGHLKRMSVGELFADEHDADTVAALAEVERLTALVDDATATFLAGDLTAARLGKIEADVMPKIVEARRRVRFSALPTIAAQIAGADDVDAEWDAAAVEQRRELIRSMFTVTVLPVKRLTRGSLDPDCIRIAPRH